MSDADLVQLAPAIAADRHAHFLEWEIDAYRAVFDNLRDLAMVCDADGRVRLINPALRRFAGLPPFGPVVGSWADYGAIRGDSGTALAPDDCPLPRTLRGDPIHDLRLVLEAPSGELRSMTVDGHRLIDADGTLLGAVIIWHEAIGYRSDGALAPDYDALTGLPSRALFLERIRGALARATRHGWSTAVLAVNLDRFGDIAHRLGGDAGDTLLTEAGQRLESSLRAYDGVMRVRHAVSRLGGDQFLLLCEHIADARAAEAVATRVKEILGAPMMIHQETLRITAGIGIAVTRDRDQDPEQLIFEAETAMHLAKQGGIGRHEVFAGETQHQLHSRMDDENGLRQALAQNEFDVAYQPKVSLLTGRVTGVEALLRWHHPERGLIAPAEFIPLAEVSGLIVPIGQWVLEQVCRDFIVMSPPGPEAPFFTVAVNVSPRQFQSGLAATFGAIIAASGISAANLCLEVTEGMVMEDTGFAVATLKMLKSLGLSISIDDFGTGFSSLAYLKRFPLDELKIDKSFIDGLGTDAEDTAIVAAIMGLANALHLHVVAEGVETADQAARLRALGCDEAQGYFFARPGPPEAIQQLAASRAAAVWSSAADAREQLRGNKILVVDDAPDIRHLARVSLAAVGYEIQVANTGEEALRLLTQFEPDCVILDLNLPGMSGLDVCRLIRSDPLHQYTTIVILAGDDNPHEKARAFSLKADDYVVKPASPRDLVSRVSTAMQRRHAMLDQITS